MDVGSAVGSEGVGSKPYREFIQQGSVAIVRQMSGGPTAPSHCYVRGLGEIQIVLRNGSILLKRRVENWDAYVKKILSTAFPVLPSALSFTWVCLLAQLRSCMWMINYVYVGGCAVVADSRRNVLSHKPRLF